MISFKYFFIRLLIQVNHERFLSFRQKEGRKFSMNKNKFPNKIDIPHSIISPA